MTRQRHWYTDLRSEAQYINERSLPIRLRLLRWLGRQTWLPRGQDRLLRMVYDPDTAAHCFFEIDFFGQRYRGDLAHYLDWLVFCYGAAPYSEISLLKEISVHIRRQRAGRLNFFDVGANAGHHTLFMAPLSDRVFAFEPLPALVNIIRERMELNAITNVDVIPFALGVEDAMLNYYPGSGANSGIGSFLPLEGAEQAQLKLAVRKGDALFSEMNLPPIDVMKVDVEGFEPYVFRGLASRIHQDRPVILTEISDASRAGFASEENFKSCFYASARFVEVTGRHGCRFELRPFDYHTCAEVLILPPEIAHFVPEHI